MEFRAEVWAGDITWVSPACDWYKKRVWLEEVPGNSLCGTQEGKEQHVTMEKVLGCTFGGLCDFEQISVFRLNMLVCRMGK